MKDKESIDQNVLDLENRLEKTNLRLHDLATMGAIITSIRDLDSILSVVMEMSVRTVDAEVGLIQLEEKDELVSKAFWGIDDAVIKNLAYKNNQNVAQYCFKTQESVHYNRGKEEFDFGSNIDCLIAIPIKSRAKCHGVMILINKADGNYFTDEDYRYLDMLVNFTSVAIDNAILLKESLQKQRMEQELTIARQIQEAILPEKEFKINGIEIGILYKPARYVSGDFYDIIKMSETDFLMVIGDVSNKGVPAAMLMATTTAIIRSELMKNPDIKPSELVFNLNNVLCNGVIRRHDMFVTLFIARIDLEDMVAVFCNAGHNPPILWDSPKGQLVELSAGGPFVGQFPDFAYISGDFKVVAGDKILAYTDGVTEAEDIHRGQFGTERLMQAFFSEEGIPANDFCIKVGEWVDRFAEGASDEPFDDFTLMEIIIKKKNDG